MFKHIYTHLPKKQKTFETNVVGQKNDGNCCLGQDRNADDEIHATRDHSKVTSLLRNTKNLRGATLNKRRRTLFYANELSHTAAWTLTLLEHFNWGLFDQLVCITALQQ
jgi:hypothetical protein